jgi:hypothetical protein
VLVLKLFKLADDKETLEPIRLVNVKLLIFVISLLASKTNALLACAVPNVKPDK